MRYNLLILLCFYALTLLPQRAYASPYLPLFLGGSEPELQTLLSPISVYENPGALSLMRNGFIFLSYAPTFSNSKIKRDTIDQSTGRVGEEYPFEPINISSTYHDFFFSVGEKFGSISLGLAMFTPSSINEHASSSGPLRYYLIDNKASNLFITPVVSMRLHSKFMAGFGVGYVFTKIERSFKRDLRLRGKSPLEDDSDFESGGMGDELVKINVQENSFVFFGGILWRPKKWLNIGLSYHSKVRALSRNNIQASGTVSVLRWFDNTGWTEIQGRAKLLTVEPDWLSLGFLFNVSKKLSLDFMFKWTRWSALDKERYLFSGNGFRVVGYSNWDVVFSRAVYMQDALDMQGTLLWQLGPDFLTRFAIRFSTPSIKRKWISPLYLDGYSLTTLVSSIMKIYPSLELRVGYSLSYTFPWHAGTGFDPYATQECLDSHIDLAWSESCVKVNNGEALPTAAGNYQKISHQLGVALLFLF